MKALLLRAGNWERVFFVRDYQHEIAKVAVSPKEAKFFLLSTYVLLSHYL